MFGKKKFVLGAIALISLIITSIIGWTLLYFGFITIENIIFQLNMPFKGAPTKYLFTFFIFSFLIPVPSFIIILILHYFCNNKKITNYLLKILLYPLRLIFLRMEVITILSTISAIIMIIIGFDIHGLLTLAYSSTDLYEKYYIDPQKTTITFPQEKNNLIIIYLESVETTYQSPAEGGFNKVNLIPELSKLASENIYFSCNDKMGGTLPINGAEWTMGAIVATNCGMPLRIPIRKNLMELYSIFLPGATTLGDILKKNGYHLVFMTGADKDFSGKDHFFKDHGNYDIIDYIYFLDNNLIPNDSKFAGWGVEDSKLIELAKKVLTDLSKDKQPFNLIFETLNTHEEVFQPYHISYEDLIISSSKQIYEFVKWIQSQPFYENTTIVIMGDHKTWDSGANRKFSNVPRKTYNVFINSRIKPLHSKNRQFCKFDMFPSILESIGVKIDAEGLALGRSLFGNDKTLIELLGYDYFNNEVRKESNLYTAMLFGTNRPSK